MRAINLISVLVLLSNIYVGLSQVDPNTPGFLLGTWTWDCEPYGCSYGDQVDEVQFISNGTNSSYLIVPQYFNYLNGEFKVPFDVTSSEQQLWQIQNQWMSNEYGQYASISFTNDSAIHFSIYLQNGAQPQALLTRTTPNNTSTCNITLGSIDYNICAFGEGQNNTVFTVNDALGGKLSFSLGQNNASSNNSEGDLTNIWAHYIDNNGYSFDVADQSPTYDFIGGWSSSQGLKITFPVVENSSSSCAPNRSFELVVNLACDTTIINLDQIPFTVSLFASANTSVETIIVNASSIYGCPTTMYQLSDLTSDADASNPQLCNSLVNVSQNAFNVCPLNDGGIFNVSDILGGSLSFSLTTVPIANCGVGYNVWGVYRDNTKTCYEVAIKNPTFSLLNEWNPTEGLQITYPIKFPQSDDVRSLKLVVTLICDYAHVDPTNIPFTMDVSVTGGEDLEVFNVSGRSVYGCPVRV